MAAAPRSRRWRYAAVALVVALVAGALVYSRGRSPRPDPTIDDAAFVAGANRLCADKLPKLRAPEEPVRSEDDREAETAAAIEAASDGIDDLVTELRDLERRPASEPEVEAWLRHWGDYADAGRRYAAAIRRGNPREYGRVDDESLEPLAAIVRFSRGNRVDACIP